MEDFLTRKEHEIFERLMLSENEKLHAEDKRINHRLDAVESMVTQVNSLTISVERMAVNMEQMIKKQDEIGDRLTKIELEPAAAFKNIKAVIATALITALVGFLVGHFFV